MRLVSYEGDDHAVEVEEKHQEVEAKLDERFLYKCQLKHPYIDCILCQINVTRPTFLCTFNFLKISVASRRCWFSKILKSLSASCSSRRFMTNRLLRIVSQQGQIEDQSDPVEVDCEENGKKGVYSGFRDDVGIESVTQIDRVDIVTVGFGD